VDGQVVIEQRLPLGRAVGRASVRLAREPRGHHNRLGVVIAIEQNRLGRYC
jgi:hypothetical protein